MHISYELINEIGLEEFDLVYHFDKAIVKWQELLNYPYLSFHIQVVCSDFDPTVSATNYKIGEASSNFTPNILESALIKGEIELFLHNIDDAIRTNIIGAMGNFALHEIAHVLGFVYYNLYDITIGRQLANKTSIDHWKDSIFPIDNQNRLMYSTVTEFACIHPETLEVFEKLGYDKNKNFESVVKVCKIDKLDLIKNDQLAYLPEFKKYKEINKEIMVSSRSEAIKETPIITGIDIGRKSVKIDTNALKGANEIFSGYNLTNKYLNKVNKKDK